MRRRVWIYESELCSIAQESLSRQAEVGGGVFGHWKSDPEIILIALDGPNSECNLGSHRFDLEYLSELARQLESDWNLSFFGDWHSHPKHRFLYTVPVDYHQPSIVDQKRLCMFAQRHRLSAGIEIIATPTWDIEGAPHQVGIHPYHYDFSSFAPPEETSLNVIPGISPVREALILRNMFPEQRLRDYEQAPKQSIIQLQNE